MTLKSYQDLLNLDLRSGTITQVKDFPEARNPAYKIWVDFGEQIGTKKTSAQVTSYSKDELLGKQVIGVLSFPPKQVGKFMSEFLLTAFVSDSGEATLASPDNEVNNGMKLL